MMYIALRICKIHGYINSIKQHIDLARYAIFIMSICLWIELIERIYLHTINWYLSLSKLIEITSVSCLYDKCWGVLDPPKVGCSMIYIMLVLTFLIYTASLNLVI